MQQSSGSSFAQVGQSVLGGAMAGLGTFGAASAAGLGSQMITSGLSVAGGLGIAVGLGTMLFG